MPSMSVLVLVVTIILCLLALVWAVVRLRLSHGPRPLVRALGVVLLLAGLYVSGLAALAGNGLRSLWNWAQRTTMTPTIKLGLGLALAGVVVWLLGSLLHGRSREQVRELRAARAGTAPAAVPAGRGAGRSASAAPAARPAKGSSAAGLDDEDAEIAALLSKRGIN